jgi:CRP-like cAMP-binding protein
MISPEIIRRFPIFAKLDNEQIETLAKLGDQVPANPGDVLFKEGDKLDKFYLVAKGAVAIFIEVPAEEAADDIAGQLTREMAMDEVVTSTVGTGELFGSSALIPPYEATASAKALDTTCSLIAFDATELREMFEEDCRFGYLMTQKAAQVLRERMRDLRIESLACIEQ